MKRLAIAILALCLVLSMTAVAESYTSPDGVYTVDLPAGWETLIEDFDMGDLLTFDEFEFMESINIKSCAVDLMAMDMISGVELMIMSFELYTTEDITEVFWAEVGDGMDPSGLNEFADLTGLGGLSFEKLEIFETVLMGKSAKALKLVYSESYDDGTTERYSIALTIFQSGSTLRLVVADAESEGSVDEIIGYIGAGSGEGTRQIQPTATPRSSYGA